MTTKYQLSDLDKSIVIEPSTPAQAAVIWLHGLGADGNDFVGLVPQLGLPVTQAVRFVFPNAPVQPVSVNAGMNMRSWYDIYSMNIADKMDLASIALSSQVLEELIQEQIDSGIATKNIVIAGFSQGGLVAINTALNTQHPLAGVMALSTYYPKACIQSLNQEINTSVPILMAHGQTDPVVPFTVAQASKQNLQSLGCDVEWHEYAMEHQVCMPEIEMIGKG